MKQLQMRRVKNVDREGNKKDSTVFMNGKVKITRKRYCRTVDEVTDGISS